MPEDLHCDQYAFRYYYGVEDHEATEKEMQTHLDKGHLSAFDTYEGAGQTLAYPRTRWHGQLLGRASITSKGHRDEYTIAYCRLVSSVTLRAR